MYFKNLKRIIFIFVLFLFAPILVRAAEARHVTVNGAHGDNVLLGGSYIELGIHPYGGFKTDNLVGVADYDTKIKDIFHPFGDQYTKQLGIAYNEHIWGEDRPNSSDLTSDIGIDYYYLSYNIGDNFYVYGSYGGQNSLSNTGFSSIKVEDKTGTSTTKLQALVTAKTPENVTLEMTISFGIDDKFFITNVKVINEGSASIKDVRFTKFASSDQDHVEYHQDTYKKLLSNPTSSKDGSSKNFAMVGTRGPITKDGWFYFSDSNQARAYVIDVDNHDDDLEGWEDEEISNTSKAFIESLWKDTISGIPNYADDDRLSIFYGDPNDENDWILLNESYSTLSVKMGDIVQNGEGETVIYTSVNNNVNAGLTEVLTSIQSKIIKKRTDKSIEINVESGYEYSIDNGTTWSITGVFTGLTANTTYSIKSRKSSDQSDNKTVEITTKKSGKDAVDLTLVAVSDTAFAVKGLHGYEYSIDNGVTWTGDETFTGLDSNKEYTVIGRVQETYDEMYGENSKPLIVKTLEHIDTALDDTANVKVDINIVEAVPTIYFNGGLLYEAVMNDADVKAAVEAGKEVKLMFDIVGITKDSDDEKHFDGNEFGFAFDIQIRLYVDNTLIKIIPELDKDLKLKIVIPSELQKVGRKFHIVRKHDTVSPVEWDILDDEDEDDTTITISNNKFSEFFVVYKDEIKNPKTGDKIYVYILILVLSISGLYLYNRLES